MYAWVNADTNSFKTYVILIKQVTFCMTVLWNISYYDEVFKDRDLFHTKGKYMYVYVSNYGQVSHYKLIFTVCLTTV